MERGGRLQNSSYSTPLTTLLTLTERSQNHILLTSVHHSVLLNGEQLSYSSMKHDMSRLLIHRVIIVMYCGKAVVGGVKMGKKIYIYGQIDFNNIFTHRIG